MKTLSFWNLDDITATEPQREHGDLSDLKQSILEVGLLQPLVVNQDGRLVAGRRRFQALKELDVTTAPVRIVDLDRLKQLKAAIEENTIRKNLTWLEEAQAIAEYDRLAKEINGEATPGQRTDLTSQPGCEVPQTQEQTAKELGISRQYVSKAAQLVEATEKYPELKQERAGNQALSKYRRKERQAVAQEKARGFNDSEVGGIICADAVECLEKLEAGSVEVIFTDPPYNISSAAKVTKQGSEIAEAQFGEWDVIPEEEYYRLVDGVAREAARVLTPTGCLYFFCDKILVSDVWRVFEAAGLNPKNVIAWRKTNPVPHARRNFASAWESVVWAVKGTDYTWNEKAVQQMHNVYEAPICGGREREEYPHPTAKPCNLCRHFIEISSNPGDMVVDCFCGSGSTIEAAIRAGRRWHGCDKNEEYCRITRRRAAEVMKELGDEHESS